MLLLAQLACLPIPAPDFRRPATLVVLTGSPAPDAKVRVCTWSTRHSLGDGCDNVTDSMAAVDGIGVPEWSTFPLVLGTESPLWADAFVVCVGTTPRGVTLRLPDLSVQCDAKLEIAVDSPPIRWGAPPGLVLGDDEVSVLAKALCDGTVTVLP